MPAGNRIVIGTIVVFGVGSAAAIGHALSSLSESAQYIACPIMAMGAFAFGRIGTTSPDSRATRHCLWGGAITGIIVAGTLIAGGHQASAWLWSAALIAGFLIRHHE